jgi:CxxC motif-containing protein (DUF1111 family)
MRAWNRWMSLVMGLSAAAGVAWAASPSDDPEPAGPVPWLKDFEASGAARAARLAVGRELFLREWVPGDPRSHGGDGLGPVYNAASCAACHRLGGPGGAGTAAENVQVAVVRVRPAKDESPEDVPIDTLFAFHSGFRTARSLVLHRQGVDPRYADWRGDAPTVGDGKVGLTIVQRNTPALFGSGLIDAIPDAVIAQGAGRWHPGFPKVKGRASRTTDGRVGRFGWKGQTASLGDFVRTACAVEMGLEVPGHPQSLNPTTPDVPAPGLDLTDAECDALTAFVASLPPPSRRPALDRASAQFAARGEQLFETIGCAACHTPKLGMVEGLYSDLLLHDLGPGAADAAMYYGAPSPAPKEPMQLARAGDPAGPSEWRTPPLWGLRDTAPYLHDGRAQTIDDAVRFHGGEAADSADLYGKLAPDERRALQGFLMSLAAPMAKRGARVAAR